MTVQPAGSEYTARLTIDYAEQHDRARTFLRVFMVIPIGIVLAVLSVAAFFAVVVAWFAILFTGRYPQGLFDFVVGVGRWWLRVQAYATLLVTDRYPPFSLT